MSREFCYRCQRVASDCICHQCETIENDVTIVVLQHPDESRHSKGTAIIASLCLQNYQRWVGEDFSQHAALNKLLADNIGKVAILFPADNAVAIPEQTETLGKINYLLVIDATWRKARKIWYLSENLHSLPALRLSDEFRSRYRIRKVPADGYLSTVESITCALAILEKQDEKFQPMLDLFDRVIEQKIESIGHQTYQKNYQDRKQSESEDNDKE